MIRIFVIVRNRPFHWQLKEGPNNENSTGALAPNAKMPPRFPGAAFNIIYATRTLLFVFVRLSFVLLARLAEAQVAQAAQQGVKFAQVAMVAARRQSLAQHFLAFGVERRR